MVDFALDAKWSEGDHWFHKQPILRKLLGFGLESYLTNLPDAAQTVLGMRDLYHRWALANLQRDRDNVAAFSNFLGSKAGAALRIEGLKWLATSVKQGTREQYWRDQRGTGDALVNLLNTTLQQNASVLKRDPDAREALVALAAHCSARQVSAALVLQERIKHLR